MWLLSSSLISSNQSLPTLVRASLTKASDKQTVTNSTDSLQQQINSKMASQSQLKKRLQVLMKRPENLICSDCPERQPRWASLIVPPPGSPAGAGPMGVFCCLECSGSHRRLGVHISFVRSVNLDQCKFVTTIVNYYWCCYLLLQCNKLYYRMWL